MGFAHTLSSTWESKAGTPHPEPSRHQWQQGPQAGVWADSVEKTQRIRLSPVSPPLSAPAPLAPLSTGPESPRNQGSVSVTAWLNTCIIDRHRDLKQQYCQLLLYTSVFEAWVRWIHFLWGKNIYICQNWCGEHKKIRPPLPPPDNTHTHTQLQTRMLLQMNSTRQMDQVIPTLYKLLRKIEKRIAPGSLQRLLRPEPRAR